MIRPLRLTPGLLLLLAPSAAAQQPQPRGFTFGVDYRGPVLGLLPTTPGANNRINEADILTFGPGAPGFPPLVAPSLAIPGDQLGITRYQQCVNHAPNTPCGIEIDAISQGVDAVIGQHGVGLIGGLVLDDLWFSVDERAGGQAPGSPTVRTEAAVGEASSDVFVAYELPANPTSSSQFGNHVGVFDGNGAPGPPPAGSTFAGIGLTEPNPVDVIPPLGDTVDSLDIDAELGFPATGQYYSLDGEFLDPASNIPNTGSAQFQGVEPGDVLFIPSLGATVQVYAPAQALGLDLGGAGTDDLDALLLRENGVPGFQPSRELFDWDTGATDFILFSVRRGSRVIGQPDSLTGTPIEPGDLLFPPVDGGFSPFPAIFYSAESLGLLTERSDGVPFGDDLNAVDLAVAPCFDCNNNGVEDAVDISLGTSTDVNSNGIPDECERIREYGQCDAASAPCLNPSSDGGCANSTGNGGRLFFTGTNRVSLDDLVLNSKGLPPNKFGIGYMGTGSLANQLGDGLRCVGGSTFRYGIQNSGSSGEIVSGPGIIATSCASFPSLGCITAGDTWYFQVWYRDPGGPCGSGFNFTNGLEVEFVP